MKACLGCDSSRLGYWRAGHRVLSAFFAKQTGACFQGRGDSLLNPYRASGFKHNTSYSRLSSLQSASTTSS